MAQTTDQRFVGGNKNFPILYEDGCLRIYKNPSSEIFVEDMRSRATMRISSYGYSDGGLQFTTDGQVGPIRLSNMIGWRVGPLCLKP